MQAERDDQRELKNVEQSTTMAGRGVAPGERRATGLKAAVGN
jgi:hypothetical protein